LRQAARFCRSIRKSVSVTFFDASAWQTGPKHLRGGLGLKLRKDHSFRALRHRFF
jgi:hypothetical protein